MKRQYTFANTHIDTTSSLLVVDNIDEIFSIWNSKISSIDSSKKELKQIAFEWIHLYLQKAITLDQVVSLLKPSENMMQDEQLILPSSLESILVDVLWLHDLTSTEVDLFKALILHLVENKLVSVDHLIENLSTETLVNCEFITKPIASKIGRVRAKTFYTSEKFSLLAEEIEGFSKLLECIYRMKHNLNISNISQYKEQLLNIMGYFDLAPFRVYDMLLDALEHFYELDIFYQLFSDFPKKSLTQLVGFKFRAFQRESMKQFSCANLCNFCAILIEKDLIVLEELYIHLSPEDETMKNEFETISAKKRDEAEKLGLVNLNQTVQEDTAHPNETAFYKFQTQVAELFAENQKLQLLAALLQRGVWKQSITMYRHLMQFVTPSIHVQVANAGCSALQQLIEPIYSKFAYKNVFSMVDNNNEELRKLLDKPFELSNEEAECISTTIVPIIELVNMELHRDILLLTKIVRLFKVCYEKLKMTVDMVSIGTCIMSAMTALECNAGLAVEVWEWFQLMPHTARFFIYKQIRLLHTNDFRIGATYHFFSLEAKHVLKRLTADNTKIKSKPLAKHGHCNAIMLCDMILDNIEKYENLIPVINDSLGHQSSLFFDVMCQSIVERLDTQKSRMQPDLIHFDSWFSNLTTFCGIFFKKYSSSEMEPLLRFILKRLKLGNWEEASILKELIKQMAYIETSDADLTDSRLEAHCGGEMLKLEGGSFGVKTKSSKKNAHKLRQVLLSTNLAEQFLILLAQMKSSLLFCTAEQEMLDQISSTKKFFEKEQQETMDETYAIRVLARNQDSCNEAFQSFWEFILEHCSLAFFSEKNSSATVQQEQGMEWLLRKDDSEKEMLYLPDMNQLLKLSIAPPILMTIVRPILRRRAVQSSMVKPLFMDSFWNTISQDLYTIFWTMDAYDIHVPTKVYEETIASVTREWNELTAKTGNLDHSTQTRKKHLESAIPKLKSEMEIQTEKHKTLIHTLYQWKEKLMELPNQNTTSQANKIQMNLLINYCIIPRIMISMVDALYAYKFIETLVQLDPKQFNMLYFVYRFTQGALACLAFATEMEVNRLAEFLRYLIAFVNHYYDSETLYDKELSKKVCFAKSVGSNDTVSFRNYKKGMANVQISMATVVHGLLRKNDRNCCRNVLLVLSRLVMQFPKYKTLAQQLQKELKPLEQDQNLKTLLDSYLPKLESRMEALEDDWAYQECSKEKQKSEKPVVEEKKNADTNMSEKRDEKRRSTGSQQQSTREDSRRTFGSNAQTTSKRVDDRRDQRRDQKRKSRSPTPPASREDAEDSKRRRYNRDDSPNRVSTNNTAFSSSDRKSREFERPALDARNDRQTSDRNDRQSSDRNDRNDRYDYGRRDDRQRDQRDDRQRKDVRDIRLDRGGRDIREFSNTPTSTSATSSNSDRRDSQGSRRDFNRQEEEEYSRQPQQQQERKEYEQPQQPKDEQSEIAALHNHFAASLTSVEEKEQQSASSSKEDKPRRKLKRR